MVTMDVLKELKDAAIAAALVKQECFLIDSVPDEDWDGEPILGVTLESSEPEMSFDGPVAIRMTISLLCFAGDRDTAMSMGERFTEVACQCLENLWDNDRISGFVPSGMEIGHVKGAGQKLRDEMLFVQMIVVYY